jgi:hypothetical protein
MKQHDGDQDITDRLQEVRSLNDRPVIHGVDDLALELTRTQATLG